MTWLTNLCCVNSSVGHRTDKFTRPGLMWHKLCKFVSLETPPMNLRANRNRPVSFSSPFPFLHSLISNLFVRLLLPPCRPRPLATLPSPCRPRPPPCLFVEGGRKKEGGRKEEEEKTGKSDFFTLCIVSILHLNVRFEFQCRFEC
jgi:hypothetical protein